MNRPFVRRAIASLAAVAGVLLGCGTSEQSDPGVESTTVESTTGPSPSLVVYSVNYPLHYFAQRLGGELIRARFPVPSDQDPAYWSPDPEAVGEFQAADLILINGAGYAKWLERATLPSGKIVDTSRDIRDRLIPLDEGLVHSHGPEGEHSHKGWAFTTWLDPQLAIAQAKIVGRVLSSALPGHEVEVESRLSEMVAELEEVDSSMEAAAARVSERPILFSHPVYQYLIARYGLKAQSLHWEPDEMPTAEQWGELERVLIDHPATVMVWEAAPQAAVVTRLAELGISSVVISPLANKPQEGDFMTAMQGNAQVLMQMGGD